MSIVWPLWRLALQAAAPRNRLSILIFHRVLPAPDPLLPGEVHAAQFDAICGWLREGFNVLPLDEAVNRLRAHSLPPRALAITFDDGYADNHEVAWPILRRHGLSATFFIATGFLDGGRMFNDSVIEAVRRTAATQLDVRALALKDLDVLPVHDLQARRQTIACLLDAVKYEPQPLRDELVGALAERAGVPLPSDLMMRSDQVLALHRGGMQIGAHTRSHPILAKVEDLALRDEIFGGKSDLEALTGSPVTLFAYPNGKPFSDYLANSVSAVREAGFEAAVSTAWGVARPEDDPLQLPRFTPWDRSSERFMFRLLSSLRYPQAQRVPGTASAPLRSATP